MLAPSIPVSCSLCNYTGDLGYFPYLYLSFSLLTHSRSESANLHMQTVTTHVHVTYVAGTATSTQTTGGGSLQGAAFRKVPTSDIGQLLWVGVITGLGMGIGGLILGV
jgi:hypothetical protein